MIINRRLGILAAWVLMPSFMVLVSCNGGEAAGKTKEITSKPVVEASPAPKLIDIIEPAVNTTVASGNQVSIKLSITGSDIPDSVRLYFDGVHFETLTEEPWTGNTETRQVRMGNVPFKAVAYLGQGRPQTVTRFVNILSDIVPPVEHFRVIATYPHDMSAYTQGLLVYRGQFIESTGQYGQSSLRMVEINSGKVIRRHDLESKYFGEGLALLNNILYQLTWKTNTGFMYDADSFTFLKNFSYNTEGWGLTTDGEKLIMSDGSNKIYFIEPDYFTVVSTLEVFDNREAVWQLNELEYINGELWANIYQTERIARIDPLTGKVLAYIDFKGILSQRDNHPNIDYFNGIAYDQESGKLFVTGKNWPKVYEIKVTR